MMQRQKYEGEISRLKGLSDSAAMKLRGQRERPEQEKKKADEKVWVSRTVAFMVPMDVLVTQAILYYYNFVSKIIKSAPPQ